MSIFVLVNISMRRVILYSIVFALFKIGSIVGGGSNYIGNMGQCSFIGGGSGNTIGSNGGAPTDASVSVILGGKGNHILGGQHSVILGGENNELTGKYSAILGGSGNTDAGFSYAGIFGCNITATRDNAFYANQYVAQNMPDGAGGA